MSSTKANPVEKPLTEDEQRQNALIKQAIDGKEPQETSTRKLLDLAETPPLVEDVNSMVHPDKDDPVEARGSGKDGVPAGTERMEAAAKANQPGGSNVDEHGRIKDKDKFAD